ncbi:MAG: hypothetical protein AAF533_10775 [Acidobacteriota bacterium]
MTSPSKSDSESPPNQSVIKLLASLKPGELWKAITTVGGLVAGAAVAGWFAAGYVDQVGLQVARKALDDKTKEHADLLEKYEVCCQTPPEQGHSSTSTTPKSGTSVAPMSPPPMDVTDKPLAVESSSNLRVKLWSIKRTQGGARVICTLTALAEDLTVEIYEINGDQTRLMLHGAQILSKGTMQGPKNNATAHRKLTDAFTHGVETEVVLRFQLEDGEEPIPAGARVSWLDLNTVEHGKFRLKPDNLVIP